MILFDFKVPGRVFVKRLTALMAVMIFFEMTLLSKYLEAAKEPASSASYTLIKSPLGEEIIRSAKGELFPVVTWEMRGNVSKVAIENNVAVFKGWCANVDNGILPDLVLVFLNGRFFYSGLTDYPQRWLMESTGNTALLESGFSFKFPMEEFDNFNNSVIQFFAVWKNKGARELHYFEQMKPGQEEYRWKKDKVVHEPGAEQSKEYPFSPYALTSSPDGGDLIRTNLGETIPVRAHTMIARLAKTQIKWGKIGFWGWAADVDTGSSPQLILMFVDGKLFHAEKTSHDTQWLIEKYAKPGLGTAGFYFTFPLEDFTRLEGSEIRFFALWGNGVVTETQYHKEYPYEKKYSTD